MCAHSPSLCCVSRSVNCVCCVLCTVWVCIFMLVFVCFYIAITPVCCLYVSHKKFNSNEYVVVSLFQCSGDAFGFAFATYHTHNIWMRQHHVDFTLNKQSTHCHLVPPHFLQNRIVRWKRARESKRGRKRETVRDSLYSYKQANK